jgi:hypothetical protein
MLNYALRLLCAIISFEINHRINPLSIHVKENKKERRRSFSEGSLLMFPKKMRLKKPITDYSRVGKRDPTNGNIFFVVSESFENKQSAY